MNQLLHEKLTQLDQKMYFKMMDTANEQEKSAYNMLSGVLKEIDQLLMDLEEVASNPSFKSIVLNHRSECEEIIEETLAILEEMSEMPFKSVIGKKFYEVFEGQMADLDDWIETINEALEYTSISFPYIEAWDIGIFLEND